MRPTTVDLCVQNARTVFNLTVDDDLIDLNPFDRLTGGLPPVERNWCYVSLDDLNNPLAACPNQDWKTLPGLCRLAGFRQGETLALQWNAVDWATNRLTV